MMQTQFSLRTRASYQTFQPSRSLAFNHSAGSAAITGSVQSAFRKERRFIASIHVPRSKARLGILLAVAQEVIRIAPHPLGNRLPAALGHLPRLVDRQDGRRLERLSHVAPEPYSIPQNSAAQGSRRLPYRRA